MQRNRKGRILVKSISRFARNTKDCLQNIRELKELGVNVRFEREGIDTINVSSELITAIYAAFAQKESESISGNMRWSYQRRMEQGAFNTYHAPVGFTLIDGDLQVNQAEAPTIQRIFTEYLSGNNSREIAATLNKDKALGRHWRREAIDYILQNERYAGNALLLKRYTTDSFPRKKKRNRGEREMYFVSGSNEAIILQEMFDQAQQLRKTRKREPTLLHDTISRQIRCSCGARVRAKKINQKWYWCCCNHEERHECQITPIPETQVQESFCRLYYKLKHQSIQYKKLYGYRKGEDGQPEIIPEQAEIVRWIYERYLTGASLRMIKEELEQQGVKCSEDSPEWTISRIRSILQNEKYCGDVLMQKTFRQDFINRKAIKNTGQLPMYLIENHHEGIVSREKYDAVQAEMARRNAAKSPSKNAVTGMASYASKYALSERLVCGECGTLYRRCTWTRNGEKRVVWRCVSRLDYGKKYCHNSPTLDEAPLQQAILAALNKAMADKNSLIRQITDAMETEIIPFPGGTMSLGDIERRLRELEQQFQTLLEKAADDPAAYGGQFKEILDEQTLLKERRSGILADNNEQAKANQRIMDAAQTLENASLHITEWDESAVRQLVETVKVLSKDEIAVTLKGGIEIRQKIVY